jgi:CheY-like chemotaxis protein
VAEGRHGVGVEAVSLGQKTVGRETFHSRRPAVGRTRLSRRGFGPDHRRRGPDRTETCQTNLAWRWHYIRPVPDTNAPRVLVIDDDPVVRDSVRALVEHFGYRCGTAADGPSGLRRLEGETWDLAITDLMLRGMTGWQVIDAIRGRAPGVPVIVITGVDDPGVRTRARQCQVSLLLKPFRLDALKAALVDALYARSPAPSG